MKVFKTMNIIPLKKREHLKKNIIFPFLRVFFKTKMNPPSNRVSDYDGTWNP